MTNATQLLRTPRDYFEQEYNGQPNFMTPERIRFGQKRRRVYELSEGRGFENEKIWGLTVLEIDDDDEPHRAREASGLHHSRASAERGIAEL